MKVTETERKESTKRCCGSGCRWRDSAEHEEYSGALIEKRIAENKHHQRRQNRRRTTGKNRQPREPESSV